MGFVLARCNHAYSISDNVCTGRAGDADRCCGGRTERGGGGRPNCNGRLGQSRFVHKCVRCCSMLICERAAGSLVRALGGHVVEYVFVVELAALQGRAVLDAPVYAALQY